MNVDQTAVLLAAILALLAAIQAWVVSKTVQHGRELNGGMDGRIVAGARAVLDEDHVLRAEPATARPDPTTAAKIASLRAQLESLEPASLPAHTP